MRAHPFHHPLLLALGALLLLTTHTLALPLYFTVVNHQIRPFGLDLSGKDARQGAAISSLISQGMIGGIKIRLPRPAPPRLPAGPAGRAPPQQQQRLVAPGQPAQGQKAYSITGALLGTAPGPIAAAPAPGTGPGGPPQLQLQAPAAQTLPPNKASVQIGGNQFFFRRRTQDGASLEDGEDGEDDWEEAEDEEDEEE